MIAVSVIMILCVLIRVIEKAAPVFKKIIEGENEITGIQPQGNVISLKFWRMNKK